MARNGKSNGTENGIPEDVMAAIGGVGIVEDKKPATKRGRSTKTEAKEIEIPKLQKREIVIQVVSTSPLIMHRFPEKAKREMLDKQMGKARTKKAAKDPTADFLDSLYMLNPKERPEAYEDEKSGLTRARGQFAFPSLAFKAAAVDACRHVHGMTMTMARQAFHVIGELVPIITNQDPWNREDVVRIGGMTKVSDLRYRGQFDEWAARITVQFSPTSITADQLVNLFNLAGFHVGVGEWRPEKGGNFGMFEVDLNNGVELIGVGDA